MTTPMSRHLPTWATVKSVVEQTLSQHPTTRGNDRLLIMRVELFYEEADLQKPSYESITRARRKIQAKGRHLPDMETTERREEKEHFMRQMARTDML